MRQPIRQNIKLYTAVLLILLLSGCSNAPNNIEPSTVPTQVVTHTPVETSPPVPAEDEPGEIAAAWPTAITSAQDGILESNPAQNTVLSSFNTTDFSGAMICASCHIGLMDQAGVDVSMPNDWRSTMMANAAKDPVWQAKVSSEVARFPALQEVIEKKCTTCHMPMAVTQAGTEGVSVGALGEGFFNSGNPLHAPAIDGVSCTLCHQVSDVNLGSSESFSGHYTVDTSTDAPDRLIYGPYQQPFANVMRNQSGFNPVYGEHMASAEMCAVCHNLYTPYVDAQGNILGEFPEQTPYTEWQYSIYAAAAMSCQSCHMPLAEGGVIISNRPLRLAARQPFFQHFFVGGNAFMLNILSDRGSELAVTADKPHFDTTMDRVTNQIGQNTANLTLKSLELKDGSLNAQLEVSIMTGHKFPTSFPSRRAWLHVTVTDATGRIVFESGQPNPDGTITGNSGDMYAYTFEPHYDLINNPDQVQIYEPVMGDNEGNVTYTLLRGAMYLKDNRLLPEGADKAQLPADIAVYGKAQNDANFDGGGDLLAYQVDVRDAAGPFTFNAELLYQPLSYPFIQDLLLDKTPLTERFGGYYGETDKLPILVAVIEPVTVK